MKFLKPILIAITFSVGIITTSFAEKWDMPMAYPATNYHSENGSSFAQCVTNSSGGELEITTHPGGSLFKGDEIKRAIQTGQTPIGERLLSAHANESPLFGIDSVPFVATSFDDAERLWSTALDKMKSTLEEQNLVYLYSVPWPPQGLYFKKPINSVSDMKGIKFRAYNDATSRIAELAGMVPVQIEAAELSQALATGIAESFVSSGSTGYDSKVWEHLTHFYDVQAWLPRNTVFANKDAYDALDSKSRNALHTCADKWGAVGLAKAKELTQFYLDGLAGGGMQILPPSPGLKTELKGFGETMKKEWLVDAGADGKAIMDAFAK